MTCHVSSELQVIGLVIYSWFNINYIQTLSQKLKKQEHLQMYFIRL